MKDNSIPGFDLARQYATIQNEIESEVLNVLRTTKYIMGERVKECEVSIAKYIGANNVIACANGSDALVLALLALKIGPEDEVIIPAFSFFATAGCVIRVGAKPIFADVRSDTYNIDENKIEKLITKKTKAIIPVHLFGQMANMDKICSIAKKYELFIVADAAQAIGATYKGKGVEAWCDIATYSLFPTKNLGAAGDAGFLATNNDELASKLSILRVHGAPRQYYHELVGLNSRMDEIQAAVVGVKLRHLQTWVKRRAEIAKIYSTSLNSVNGIIIPAIDEDCVSVWHQYTLCCNQRDSLREFLKNNGVGSMVYYPLALNKQPCFNEYAVVCPVAEKLSMEVLSLPIFPELTDAEVHRVIKHILEFQNNDLNKTNIGKGAQHGS